MYKKINILIKSLVLILTVITLLGAGLYLLLSSDYAGAKVSEALCKYSGGSVSIKNLSGNFINKTAFNGVEIKKSPGCGGGLYAIDGIKADSACVQYSILSMLKNQKIAMRNMELNNVKINISHDKLDFKPSFVTLLDGFKNAVSRLFYNGIISFYINKVYINQLSLIFDKFNTLESSHLVFNNLKIIPKNVFMSSYYFESLIEMLHGKEVIIPSCSLKGEIDLNNMAFRLFVEAERIKLADFNWLLNYFSKDYRIENGLLLTSTVINYSQPEGLQIFGSAVVKNLVLNKHGFYNITGETLNINFNENSIKLINSKFIAEDILFTVNGIIENVFSSENLKADLKLKSANDQAEKYLALAKKHLKNEALNSYYATGNVFIESEIAGIGKEYSRWDHKTSIEFKNVDLASQKMSMAFERINGRLEGDSRFFKTAYPVTLKIANCWHELQLETKNYNDREKMTYNLHLKEHVPAFHNAAAAITEDEDSFVAFEYDEKDETWGGEGFFNGEQPAAAVTANASKNLKGHFCSLNARINNIAINGLFGIDQSRLSAKLYVRNQNINIFDMTLLTQGSSFAGDLKISAERGGKYNLKLRRIDFAAQQTSPENAAKNEIKLAGYADAFGKDIKNLACGDALKPLSGKNAVIQENPSAPEAGPNEAKPSQPSFDIGKIDGGAPVKM
ncbi:MAG: hypothetical protein BWY32_03406 [bacterium ADurb.Bin243]|nr:MAG: hypothetical protein BWY32_03406 [bacterium ADurb.Bin243]